MCISIVPKCTTNLCKQIGHLFYDSRIALSKDDHSCLSPPQVKSGTIFDNVLITDDEEYAAQFAEDTWGKTKDPEKKMKDKVRA